MRTQLTKYNPFSLAQEIQNELNRFFNNGETDLSSISTSNWCPPLDIQEQAGEFVIKCDLPDVDKKDIDISVENNILTIRGNRNLENRHAESGYSRVERISGSFYRQLTLPGHIDSNKIQAKSKNGVLEITIPKTEQAASKRIEVTDK